MQKRALGHALDNLPKRRVCYVWPGKGEHLACESLFVLVIGGAGYAPVIISLILTNLANDIVCTLGGW